MKRFLIFLSNIHEHLLRAVLILISIATIVLLLPKEARYRFDFQKGKPWGYENLIAPFDFAILKSLDELSLEKKKLLDNTKPYFQADILAEADAYTRFSKELAKRAGTDISTYQRLAAKGNELLDRVYHFGILKGDDPYANRKDDLTIVILRNKVEQDANLADLYTVKSAYELFTNELNQSNDPDYQTLLNSLEEGLVPNIYFDEVITSQVHKDILDKINPAMGMVQQGQNIILKGELVDNVKYQILLSLKSETENRLGSSGKRFFILLGYTLLVTICISMLMLFLYLFRRDIFHDNQKVSLLLLLMIIMAATYTWALKTGFFSLYLVPLCIMPVIIRTFFDTRLALYTHLMLILMLGFIAPNGLEFVLMQMISGMVAIFSILNLRKRAQLFISAGYILLAYSITYLTVSLIHEGSIVGVDFSVMPWFVGNALLTLFAFPMIYVFEKLFGFISEVSLMELSDLNSPLLRELSLKAPGTFQHSLQVANLAEAATFAVGGNTLLVRTGALYHDIGKVDMPMYFIENQNTQVNPHDELMFEESARIIISHVIKGIEKARKNKLPEVIIDFIRTHHGTTMVQYFYQSFLKNYPEKIVDEDDFRYPGPMPFSKETAVLMMADSVEASSRSLKKVDADSISKLVDQIIENQNNQGQFANCDITYRDITKIKKIFKRMLMSIYHVRVEYPAE